MKKVALIMGIANQRSIAWSCLERFLQCKDDTVDGDDGWSIIYTVQNEKTRSKVEALLEKKQMSVLSKSRNNNNILGGFVCDVMDESSMQQFFRQALPDVLQQQQQLLSLQAVIHSIAFASQLRTTSLLETNRESFLEAHDISAYSLVEVARESLPYLQKPLLPFQTDDGVRDDAATPSSTRSITTLSYLGSTHAIPGYNVMGPAKASLEGVVRGLAVDLGRNGSHSNNCPVRVNAVRAGPLPTISSKGGIAGFDRMRKDVEDKAPLGNVTVSQVADSVYHVAAEAHGMTGQCINIDGGYSIVAGPSLNDVL